MTFLRLLTRNLRYHWRSNLAVFLGMALGTAVLTGALLVGDSLRGSLRALTLDRLGWVEQAMTPGRFFRAALAEELAAPRSSPVILLSASASHDTAMAEKRHVGGITVLGVDPGFWGDASPLAQADSGVVLNQALADRLGVTMGDTITLNLPKPTAVPRESLMGGRKPRDVLRPLEVSVRQVLPDEGIARFALTPSPAPALNSFISLRQLQDALDLPGQANAVLIAGGGPDLADRLRDKLTLEDWGLRLRTPKDRALAFVRYLNPNSDDGRLKPARWRGRVPGPLAEAATANKGVLTREQVIAFYEKHRPYISLESRQLLLPPAVVTAGEAAAAHAGPDTSVRSVYIYLADDITNGPQSQNYVVVGAVQTSDGKPWPAAPGNKSVYAEIVLIDTPEAPWKPRAGDTVTVGYYRPDDHNHLAALNRNIIVRSVLPMRGELDDPDLTPELPGITDQLDMGRWENPPFPYDAKRVTAADEEYWKRYRATPRAYVDMHVAEQFWGSRFGNRTAMQFFGIPAERLRGDLLANLPPARGGFVIQDLRRQGEAASAGSTDFGVLFIAFSCFLIAAALLLVGLLVRLNIDRRASEIGLLLALGWDHRRARLLLLGEGALLALAGGAVGLAGAVGYAHLMLDLLRANWPGGESLSFLRLHAEPSSFVNGYVGALVVSVLTLVWATRVLVRVSPRALLAGETGTATAGASGGRAWSRWVLALALLGAGAAIIGGWFAPGQEAKAGSFFGCGALLLTACLAAGWIWLRHTGRQSTPRPSLTALGVRNAGRHAVRSLLTVGLLASATFLIVAVESFHKDAHADLADDAGNRLALIAETSVPVFQDLNRPEVRRELGLTDDLLFSKVWFYPCRVSAGDDASCLNLYKPLAPRVLGLSPYLLSRWHFGFAAVEAGTPKDGPWQVLSSEGDGGAVPAALDKNTAQWIVKKSLGDTLDVDDGRGEKVQLRVAALLEESIFQSEVVISEPNFRKLFPRQEGFAFFLVECRHCTNEEVAQVQSALEAGLAGQGVRVQTPAARLQGYLAVENTYLATFQALGGLGLVLGAVGLAIILLRGVWERRGELALLRALGFSSARLAWLVLAENLVLLILGLASGTLAALASVAPHLAGAGAPALWLRIGGLLLLVLVTGLAAGGLAVVTTLRAPLLGALRRE